MRVHVSVVLIALLAGISGGYGLSLLLRAEGPAIVAISEPEWTEQAPEPQPARPRDTKNPNEQAADATPSARDAAGPVVSTTHAPSTTYAIRAQVVEVTGEP